jgi:DnaJ family protein C protein 7
MCEQSLALDPSNAKIRARLATAQVATGDFALARNTLGDVDGNVTLANTLKQIDEWEKMLSTADSTLSNGEPAKALSLYADLETKALFSCSSLALRMGRCYLELKNYPRVLNTTQQVLRGSPRNIDALVLRTEALYRNNTTGVDSPKWPEPLEQGQRLLKEALSFDPDHAAAQALRKRLRLLCGKHAELKQAFDNREFEKCREVIDEMAEKGQDNPVMLAGLYCQRAVVNTRLKEWTMVLKDVGQATYRNHELVQPYMLRAQALQALERHEDAVKELEQLFSWQREQSVYDKLQDAKFLLKKKKRANYYELLGVPSIATPLEIKKAYRERASEWHPDKKSHLDEAARKNAEGMFKRIGEAYEVLTDTNKKDLYDKGYDLEGIEEQIELKKRRKEQQGCGPCRPGGCQ